jgi:hypothetical protein
MHPRKILEVYCDAECVRDPRVAHAREDAFAVCGERGVVEMAMRVYVHV